MRKNEIVLIGMIISDFTYSHTRNWDRYYTTNIAIERMNKVVDIIPLVIPGRFINANESIDGQYAFLTGEVYMKNDELSVFVNSFNKLPEPTHINDVTLEGCVYSMKSLEDGRMEIALKINYASDVVKCICWEVQGLEVGDIVIFNGSIHTRECEGKTNYELSVNFLQNIDKFILANVI